MEALLDNDNSIKQLKKQRTIFIGTTFLFLISTIIFIITTFIGFKAQWSLIPSKSIIPVVKESSVEGKIDADSAAYYNRSADVKNSKYYPILNFYDGTVTSTLKILPKFKTYQQSSPISCGDASALMALRYFGIDTITEYDLYKEAKTMPGHGTNTENLGKALQKLVGDKFTVTYKKDDTIIKQDEFQTMVKDCTKPSNNKVMLLESVEWGGHWMTLIGYDDMGTKDTADDVLVFADPYDTTDHNQDGYYIVSFERYFSTWFDRGILSEGHRVCQYVLIVKN